MSKTLSLPPLSLAVSLFLWLTKQQTMETGAKERSTKLRYKQSKGHFANGLTFQQVWGPIRIRIRIRIHNPQPPHAVPCRAVFRVAEVVAEAFLTALKHKL